MKKNIIMMAFLAILSFVCVSCGGGGDDTPTPDTPNQPGTDGDTPAPVDNTFPDPEWEKAAQAVIGVYEKDMTFYLSLSEEATQVAVFCGDECRGVAYKDTRNDGKTVWIGMAKGNDGDVLTFKYYASATKFLYNTGTTFTFKADDAFGNVDEPVQVSFTQVTR